VITFLSESWGQTVTPFVALALVPNFTYGWGCCSCIGAAYAAKRDFRPGEWQQQIAIRKAAACVEYARDGGKTLRVPRRQPWRGDLFRTAAAGSRAGQ